MHLVNSFRFLRAEETAHQVSEQLIQVKHSRHTEHLSRTEGLRDRVHQPFTLHRQDGETEDSEQVGWDLLSGLTGVRALHRHGPSSPN